MSLVLALIAAQMSCAGAVASEPVATEIRLCASCHGRDGLPSDHTVPIIWGQRAAYLQKQLNDYRNGDRDSQIMSSIAESLGDRDVSQIAMHFGDAKWPEPPSAPATRSRLVAPAAIAMCQACHQANLTGGVSPAGVAPRLAGQFSSYLVETMNAYADGERANSTAMSALMQSLSPADRTKIADYLATLR